MSLIGWKAWVATQYGFTRYNSLQHTWEEIPEDGMLALRTYEDELKANKTPQGFKLIGADYYFMAPGANDVITGIDYDSRGTDKPKEIMQRYPGAIIKRGKWTDVVTFELVRLEFEAATQWP